MRCTVLGCGASTGVPVLGCSCGVCRSDNPKNTRLRASILLEHQGFRLLVDAGPDVRAQLLRHAPGGVDAVLLTHEHFDHAAGLIELRAWQIQRHQAVPIYCMEETYQGYLRSYPLSSVEAPGKFPPKTAVITPHFVPLYEPYRIGPFQCLFYPQPHGVIRSLGLRIGNFAYSTDLSQLDARAISHLQGLDLWILDCLRHTPSTAHLNVAAMRSLVERVKPAQTYLTQMAHEIDYDEACHFHPGVLPAYDGLSFTFQ